MLEFVHGGQIMEWRQDESRYARKDGSVLTEAECVRVIRDLALGLDYRTFAPVWPPAATRCSSVETVAAC